MVSGDRAFSVLLGAPLRLRRRGQVHDLTSDGE
jgi:hypothetical protein